MVQCNISVLGQLFWVLDSNCGLFCLRRVASTAGVQLWGTRCPDRAFQTEVLGQKKSPRLRAFGGLEAPVSQALSSAVDQRITVAIDAHT